MLLLLLALLSQASSPQVQFERAVQALSSGDLAKAEEGFRSVLKFQPNSLPALANLGVVYSRMDRPSDAIEIYRRALKISPSEPRLLLNLGLAHLKLEDYAAAEPLFAEALRKEPGNLQVRELLGTAQVLSNHPKQALTTLESLPDTPGVSYLRMVAFLKLKQPDEAKKASDALFSQIEPAEANFLAGRAYYESTLFDDAARSLEKAAELKPDLPGVQRELGKAYVSLRKSTEAKERLRAALSQNAFDQEAAYFLGALLVQSDEITEGMRYLEQSRKTRPDFWGVYYYLGRAQLEQGDVAAAIVTLTKATELNAVEPSVFFQLARALKAAGRDAESRKAAAKVRELRAKSADKEREALVIR